MDLFLKCSKGFMGFEGDKEGVVCTCFSVQGIESSLQTPWCLVGVRFGTDVHSIHMSCALYQCKMLYIVLGQCADCDGTGFEE